MKTRKDEHIRICLEKDVDIEDAGFEDYGFMHNALPDINMDEIKVGLEFLGYNIGAPLMILSMTGGTDDQNINRNLAIAAQNLKIPISLGSMRILFENEKFFDEFNVKKLCPDVPLIANLGAVQLNNGIEIRAIRPMLKRLNADALSLHLNPLQEAIQPEGQTNFKGLLNRIKELNTSLDCPIILKEVGFGISYNVAKQLKNIGVKYFDVSGHGGTNWAIVEGFRRNPRYGKTFREWGIKTTDAIRQCKDLEVTIIGSGGIRSGIDIAKALALGSTITGIAKPLLGASIRSSSEVEKILGMMIEELRIAMFCTGSKTIDDLNSKIIYNPRR